MCLFYVEVLFVKSYIYKFNCYQHNLNIPMLSTNSDTASPPSSSHLLISALFKELLACTDDATVCSKNGNAYS